MSVMSRSANQRPQPTEAFGIEAATAEMKRANDTAERFTSSGGQVDRAVSTFERFTASVQQLAETVPTAAVAGAAGAGAGSLGTIILIFVLRLLLWWLKKRLGEPPT